jgi:hypothetical protein
MIDFMYSDPRTLVSLPIAPVQYSGRIPTRQINMVSPPGLLYQIMHTRKQTLAPEGSFWDEFSGASVMLKGRGNAPPSLALPLRMRKG